MSTKAEKYGSGLAREGKRSFDERSPWHPDHTDTTHDCNGTCAQVDTLTYPAEWKHIRSHPGHLCGFFRAHAHTFYDHHAKKYRHWSSRHHRKGIIAREHHESEHPLVVRSEEEIAGDSENGKALPVASKEVIDHDANDASSKRSCGGLHLFHLLRLQIWNVSWWSAVLFTIGSCFWVLNGVIIYHHIFPAIASENEDKETVNNHWAFWTGLAGGTLFFLGGWTTWWEAINIPQHTQLSMAQRTRDKRLRKEIESSPLLHCLCKTACCGYCCGSECAQPPREYDPEVDGQLTANDGELPVVPLHRRETVSDRNSSEPHPNGPQAETMDEEMLQPSNGQAHPDSEHDRAVAAEEESAANVKWRWVGWISIRDLGFMASWTQWVGTQVFWISVVFGIIGVYGYEEYDEGRSSTNQRVYDALFWAPQIVGATFLLISSALMQLECQSTWWKPNPTSLGWQVGFWNVIGSLGFLLSGIAGTIWRVNDVGGRLYGVSLVSYIGSCAYLLGSFLQYLEIAR